MRRQRLTACLVLLVALITLSSCATKYAEARSALEEYLQNMNTRSIEIDFFHTNPSFPDRAYVSATVTYNFATSDGTFQKEYLGYILRKEGNSWKVAQNTGYTKDPSRANTLLINPKS